MSNFKYERYENEEDGGNNPTPGSQDPPPPYTVEAGRPQEQSEKSATLPPGSGASFPPEQGVGASLPPQQGVGSSFSPQQGVGASFPPHQGVGAPFPPQQGVGATFPPQQVYAYDQYPESRAQGMPYGPQQPYGAPSTAPAYDQFGRVITGQPVVQQVNVRPCALEDPPSDCLGVNILACLCCCWILGIFGIIASVQTREAIQRGDGPAAKRNSAAAKGLAFASIIIGSVIFVVLIILKTTVLTEDESSSRTYYG